MHNCYEHVQVDTGGNGFKNFFAKTLSTLRTMFSINKKIHLQEPDLLISNNLSYKFVNVKASKINVGNTARFLLPVLIRS